MDFFAPLCYNRQNFYRRYFALNKRVFSELQPERVFYYFEEICGIPHGSRNTRQISDYLVRFAQEHGLRWVQDVANNVVIYSDGKDLFIED